MRVPAIAVSRSLALAGLATLLTVTGCLSSSAQSGRPKKVLFVSQPAGKEVMHVYSMNPDGSGRARLTPGDTFDLDPALSPDGKRVAFVAGAALQSRKVDLYAMNADGSGRKRLTDNRPGLVAIGPSWSPDGKRIYFTQVDLKQDANGPAGQIWVIDAEGKNARRVGTVTGLMPALSPDGKRILFTVVGKDAALCVMNADGTGVRRLREMAVLGSWSPDGKKIAYTGDPGDGQGNIFVADADGSNPVALTRGKELSFGPQWSPDGKRIYFSRMHLGGGREMAGIYAVDPDGKNETRLSKADSMEMLGGAVLLLGQSSNQEFKKVEPTIK
jgi:TolB protein